MKPFIFPKNLWASVITVLLAALAGCDNKEEPMKWVDLRYDVPQDSYIIDAAGTETVTIRVKSTDPWTVFGSGNEDWYTITPSSGEAGEIYTVTISCSENTQLDDRADTINVKSDYWTGKQFLITQKGTAFLEYEEPQSISQSGEPVTLEVLSNQNWRAEVTEGSLWLNISEGASGNGSRSITLVAVENTGEERYGKVTIYDRHDKPVQEVKITQNGVVLIPQSPENGVWFRLYEQAQVLRIPVESNARWTVRKEKPEDETWYEIEGESTYEGSTELILNISEYVEGGGSAVRNGTIILSTEAAEGVTPVVKTIRIKQASPDANRTSSYEGGVLNNTGITSEEGQRTGLYNFYLAPFDASTCIYLYFMWQNEGTSFAELRFWLNTSFAPMKTEIGCMPYCNDVNKWQSNLLVPFDNTKTVKIGLDIRESEPDAAGNTWIYTEWVLNDVVIARATSDGIVDRDGNTDTWKVPFNDISAGGFFRIWAFTGEGKLEKWEYIAPLDWGE